MNNKQNNCQYCGKKVSNQLADANVVHVQCAYDAMSVQRAKVMASDQKYADYNNQDWVKACKQRESNYGK